MHLEFVLDEGHHWQRAERSGHLPRTQLQVDHRAIGGCVEHGLRQIPARALELRLHLRDRRLVFADRRTQLGPYLSFVCHGGAQLGLQLPERRLRLLERETIARTRAGQLEDSASLVSERARASFARQKVRRQPLAVARPGLEHCLRVLASCASSTLTLQLVRRWVNPEQHRALSDRAIRLHGHLDDAPAYLGH